MPSIFDAYRPGIAVGPSLRSSMMVRPEDNFARQLEDIVAELAFLRGPGPARDYSNEIGIN